MKMHKLLRMQTVQSLTVLMVSFFASSTGWSVSELLFTMESWKFEAQREDYLVRFTIRLANGYERPIEKIDAFLYLEDKSGNDLEKVYINPYIKIQPGESRENTWIYMMNPFAPMLKMKPDNIRAKLVVRGLNFSVGEDMTFTIGSGVIY